MKTVKKIIRGISLLLFLFSYHSCTKEINVGVSHEKQTVIFGALQNGTNNVVLDIQNTVPVNAVENFETINDASVAIFTKDAAGNTNIVVNDFMVNDGIYTSTNEVTPTIGEMYWVEVTLLDGTLLKSEEEMLKPVVPIESIEISTDSIVDIKFSDPANDRNFYRFGVDLFANGQLISSTFSESNDVVFDGNENASLGIELYENNENATPYDTIRVYLQNINSSSFQFYINQSAQTEANDDDESSGDPSRLFATPPVNLVGNIQNTTTNKLALGNFTVLSESVFIQQ
ncbi:MAG: hypothetical protein AAF617_00055 [Bacteroidota bacterium]